MESSTCKLLCMLNLSPWYILDTVYIIYKYILLNGRLRTLNFVLPNRRDKTMIADAQRNYRRPLDTQEPWHFPHHGAVSRLTRPRHHCIPGRWAQSCRRTFTLSCAIVSFIHPLYSDLSASLLSTGEIFVCKAIESDEGLSVLWCAEKSCRISGTCSGELKILK